MTAAGWCGPPLATLQTFLDLLAPERAATIKLISADAAEWIGDCATAACTNATLCLDPFHIVGWASQALDVVRRWAWNVLRYLDLPGHAKQLKISATRCRRTPKISPPAKPPSWPGPPATTTSSTGPTC
jgi:transposase